MRNRVIITVIIIVITFSLVSCVSMDEYNEMSEELSYARARIDELEYQVEDYKTEINALENTIEELEYELDKASKSTKSNTTKSNQTSTTKQTQIKVVNDSSSGEEYILNTNSYKFHYPNCPSVDQMADHNKKVFYGTRDEVIAQGYDPCGRCNP